MLVLSISSPPPPPPPSSSSCSSSCLFVCTQEGYAYHKADLSRKRQQVGHNSPYLVPSLLALSVCCKGLDRYDGMTCAGCACVHFPLILLRHNQTKHQKSTKKIFNKKREYLISI